MTARSAPPSAGTGSHGTGSNRTEGQVNETPQSTVDRDEIDRFQAVADAWWDPNGDFRPLHRLNPARLQFIRDQVCRHFARPPQGPEPFTGLKVLDLGCGGGLLAEPVRRLGADVTGIDAAEKSIAIAQLHAEEVGLEIDYRVASPEALAAAGTTFDVVLNMEVVEHVADVDAFLAAAASLIRPGGAMVITTLNRTLKSLALAKIGAEYILRWLPRGTHDWNKFLKPSELARGLRAQGLDVQEIRGMAYNPLNDSWRLSRTDVDVNYLMFCVKPETA